MGWVSNAKSASARIRPLFLSLSINGRERLQGREARGKELGRDPPPSACRLHISRRGPSAQESAFSQASGFEKRAASFGKVSMLNETNQSRRRGE